MMFNKHTLLILTAFSVFTIGIATSCSKNTSVSAPFSSISATVGTTSYNAQAVGTYSSGIDNYYIASASFANNDTISLDLSFPTLPVNHPIDLDTSNATLTYMIGLSNPVIYQGGFQSGHLILTLSSLDTAKHMVTGVFQGSVYNYVTGDTLAITNGKFSSGYTVVQ
jgi:hypothetical protein